MDENLDNMIREGLKEMEKDKAEQDLEDKAKLSVKVISTMLEIMNEVPRGTYDDITPEEGSAIIESIEKRYPPLKIKDDPGFLFWGILFLHGYETFTVDFLDKLTKLEPDEIKLFFKGLYDVYCSECAAAVINRVETMEEVINSYDNGTIEETIEKYKKDMKEILGEDEEVPTEE